MTERNGVRIGQPVRDLDSRYLGRVKALYDRAFLVGRGFPILFRREQVIPYDEVRGERDGALVVSRSARELLELAEGGMPATWRVPVPPGFPGAATPGEARGVREAVALGHAVARHDEAWQADGEVSEVLLEAADADRRVHRPAPSEPVLGS